MRTIFSYFLLLLVLVSCSKTDQLPYFHVDILRPVAGQLISGDTLHFTVHLKTSQKGLLKISLTNENGVSILNPLYFELAGRDTTVHAFFVLGHPDYSGRANLVALWAAADGQHRKSVGVLLSNTVSYRDAFVLYRAQGAELRLIQMLADGSIRADLLLNAVGASNAVWSVQAQMLALLQPDRRSVVALKYPFNKVDFTLQASFAPHEFSLMGADGGRFWLAEKSGHLRAVRAMDGQTLVSLPGNADSLPYAMGHSSQFSAVAYLSGGNRHSIRIYHRSTGALHSRWPLNGRVVDLAWKSEGLMNLALRRPSGIELYEITPEPPSIKLIRNHTFGSSDSLFFLPDKAYMVRRGRSLAKYSENGHLLWQKELPALPVIVTVSSGGCWVQMDRNLLEINPSGQNGRLVTIPDVSPAGQLFSAIYAPLKN